MAEPLIPAELFMARGVWFIAEKPLSQIRREALNQIIQATFDHTDAVLLFTSEEKAAIFALGRWGHDAVLYKAYAFTSPQFTGLILGGLAAIGCKGVTFDPEPSHAGHIFPIETVLDDLHRYVFGPGASPN